MNLDEHVSSTRMLIWSLIVVSGVLLLALLTPEHPAGASSKRCYYNHQCDDPISNRVQLHAHDKGQYLNIEMDFVRDDQSERPALSCGAPNRPQPDSWSKILATSAKQLVISFDN
ncbi:hypothetical protein EOPP23_05885 [Endozoicomonas sp. OPT23]|uniref:hypothetical protein n=1 Tax=Endozoicomonas sp. OPT23 TaxID=2072845 RepID=UPI00129B0ACA|nr:hypothetical protein [Endozoicomonas sp. OPT23]MRI32515.1 hypothetical protein [Endozoicomonas sp. OPT23]